MNLCVIGRLPLPYLPMNLHTTVNPSNARLSVVILIGADNQTLDRALSLGLNVFLMQPPDRVLSVQHPGVVGMLVADDRFINKDDLVEMARTLARLYNVQCALSLNEYGCLPAAWINEALDSPGVSVRAVELTRNKLAMRAATAAIDPLPWAELHCDEDVIAFGRKAGWPVIVKPYDGVGSKSVHKVDSESHMPRIEWNLGGYIGEKYLAGRLISVDSYSRSGRHAQDDAARRRRARLHHRPHADHLPRPGSPRHAAGQDADFLLHARVRPSRVGARDPAHARKRARGGLLVRQLRPLGGPLLAPRRGGVRAAPC